MTFDPLVDRQIRRDPVEVGGEFYHLVPKGPQENLEFRRRVLDIKGVEPRRNFWVMCARDILFFCNSVGWISEPRHETCSTLPFLTHRYQDEFFTVLEGCLRDRKSLCVVKTREMGLTWMMAYKYIHTLLFRPRRFMACMSRVEGLVDATGNPGTIMGKMDFILEMLPRWMVPSIERRELHIRNMDNGSVIDGASTTGASFRSDRRYMVFVDEHAHIKPNDAVALHSSLFSVADCLVYGSTPNGTGNMFEAVANNQDGKFVGWERVWLPWTVNPLFTVGIEKTPGGWTSPWYEKKAGGLGHRKLVAQELDMDFGASQFNFFEAEHVSVLRAGVRAPRHRGHVGFDAETGEFQGFTAADAGDCLLWCDLVNGFPPDDRTYTVGADISAGTGSSNSAIYVADDTTGEQVAELATPFLPPERFAALVRAMALWFHGSEAQAGIIWERNSGFGQHFTRRILEMGVDNPYFEDRGAGKKEGHHTGIVEKLEAMSDMRAMVMAGKFVPRSNQFVDECLTYIYVRKGGQLAVDVANESVEQDPSGAGEAHGDRATAGWLCCKFQRQRREGSKIQNDEPDPVGSYGWMMRQLEERQRPRRRYWLPRPGEVGYRARSAS